MENLQENDKKRKSLKGWALQMGAGLEKNIQ
jgi:hypothetical protein